MSFLPLPGTPRCVLPVGVELVAEVELLDPPAVWYEGREADEPPVTSWYDGGGSAGIFWLDAMLIVSSSDEVETDRVGWSYIKDQDKANGR